ncbi:MAG: 5'-nucleotidase C-terminal domain-containing protein [Myxococcota bacterium]
MKRNSAFLQLTLALCLAFTACGGDDGEQGPRGPGGATGPEGDAGSDGSDGASSLFSQTPFGPDDQCTNGGIRLDSGVDTNRDGTLNEDEITESNVLCSGPRPFSLQLLHFADVDGNEATALENVDEFSALVDGFRNDELFGSRTLVVSSGDNVIPGPRWFAAEDSSVRAITGSNQPGHADHFFMNEFGVVASAIGNHELDQGPGEFADSIAADTFEDEDAGTSVTFEGTRFPYLAANIDFSQEEDLTVGEAGADSRLLGGQVAPSATVAIGGETIGLVGVSTPALSAITSAGRLSVSGSTTEIAELAAAVQPTIDALVTEGINKIIVLAHLQQIALEKALAEELRHVDVIVAGGSNTRMGNPGNTLYPGDAEFDEVYPFETTDADGNPLVIVNVDGDYKYLGRLVVSFDEDGLVIPSSIDPTVSGAYAAVEEDVAFSGGTPIEAVVELRDAIDIVIAEQFSNVVGHTDVFLEGRRGIVRTEETNLGNLTADSLKWYAQRCTGLTNVIALKNGGGIRAEIGNAVTVGTETTLEPPFNDGLEGVEPGDVSEGHFRGSLRFDNGAVVVSVTPAELKMILEHAVAETGPGATPGQFPQVGGIWVGFDPAGTAQVLTVVGEGDDRVVTGVATPGTRVTDLWVDTDADGMVDTALYTNGELLTDVEEAEDARRYDLVTLNFIANGGDDAPFALLSEPMRRQLYEGLGFDDPDEDENDMADFPMLMGCDPGLQNDFSGTGREQDILAEYFLEFFPDPDNAFADPETAPIDDRRVQNVSMRTFVEPTVPVAVAMP